MNEIIIYTDGACKYNPGPGGYAAIIFDKTQKKGIKGNNKYTTNNIMELTSVIEALKWTLSFSTIYLEDKNSLIKVYSDSNYVVNSINNKWLWSWEEKGWKNSSGNVKNKELWEEMISILENISNIEFIKVKGHSNNKYNNLCDKFAVEEAAKAKEELIKEAEADGIVLNDDNISEYLENLSRKNENIYKENNENQIKDFLEKEERQSDTIASLVIENSKLKNKIRILEEKIKILEEN